MTARLEGSRPATRCLLLALAIVIPLPVAGCYRVRSQLIPTAVAPVDLYRCVQLELGRAGYAIVGADQASGWLHAQKRIDNFWETKQAEIYATVIPDEGGSGAHLQLTDNSHATADAERSREACVPS